MKKIFIKGLGYYVPDKILTNQDLEKIVDTTDEWITQRTGIKERHILEKEAANSDMIVNAAQKAIEQANIDIDEIDAIIVGTVTPDYIFPSTAAIVQKKLGIKDVMAFDYEAGCSGFVYGLDIARGLLLSGNYRNVLVAGSETLTRITNWKDRNSCVLFGDASGVFILGTDEGRHELIDVINSADGTLGDLLIQYGGGCVNPISHEVVDKDMMYINMDRGSEIFKWAILYMTDMCNRILEKNKMTIEQMDWLIPHQANIRIMEKVAERLKIPVEKVVITVHEFGNASAATIPVAIGRYEEQNRFTKDQMLLLTAFGAGFTMGSALIRW